MNRHVTAGRVNLSVVYLVLVLILSVPFWLVGGGNLPLPIHLPVSALMFVTPMIAASILSFRRKGSEGVKHLLKRAFDFGRARNKIWFVPALLLIPSIYLLSFIFMRWTGLPIPASIEIPFQLGPVWFLLFFVPALCEELGWSGYAIDPLQQRWGALPAGILLGIAWQLWHVIPDLQAQHPPSWILWHSLYSVGLRVLIVWVYNNTGASVFAAILVHTSDNVSWSLFPNYGSHFDPFVACIVTLITVAIVTFAWGPKTLAHFRYAF